jgi:hypothetical protein
MSVEPACLLTQRRGRRSECWVFPQHARSGLARLGDRQTFLPRRVAAAVASRASSLISYRMKQSPCQIRLKPGAARSKALRRRVMFKLRRPFASLSDPTW